MGAWAQDPVPGAAAGAALSPGALFRVPGKMLDLRPGCALAAAPGTGSCAHAPMGPWF